MSDSATLVSAFVHGIAAGAMIVIALGVWRSGLSIHVRIAAALAGISIVAWLITESLTLYRAMGAPYILLAVACPVAGLFWLFVLTVFSDWRVTSWTLVPAAVLLVTGMMMGLLQPPLADAVWASRNIVSALLAAHAGIMVLRGWRNDLVEGRRRFRALLLVVACLYVLVEVGSGFAYRLDRGGPWLLLAVGQPFGGVVIALLNLSLAMLALQASPAAFGASRRAEPVADARAEAADRLTLQELDALMAAEAWRREGLTIGDLARELGAPEHRLRRLINQRLGHRNFADFVNGHRIAAAKQRLADPAQARTTVAAVAFDLGYGSLGPFNRAFREATGLTPTEWRRQALAAASPELQQAV